ncbi:MAG TPA: DUF4912 domain-containing protein [Anaeromyxobacteraceae bacterium]|jgi:hypothetical protein
MASRKKTRAGTRGARGRKAAGAPKAAARAAKAKPGAAVPKAAGARGGARKPVAAAPAPERKRRPAAARALPPPPRPAAEPDPESHFVARVRGEEAVREAPHPMTEAAVESAAAPRGRSQPRPRPDADDLGDLPWGYGDDALVALPRDPSTLFLYWDHAAPTLERAWAGLQGGRAEIWLFARRGDEWERVRVEPFALEARSWYLHDLEPGRLYRAEIHIADARQERLLPRPSNAVRLPPVGPSALVDDRFARIDWGVHLARWLGQWRAGAPFADDLREHLARFGDWARFGAGAGGGSAGGMGGRPSSPWSAPGSPSSPWGGGR